MDIEYLLILQEFRGYTESFLAPIMDWVTKMSVSFWPLAVMLMIYWVFDRQSGKRMLAGFSLALLMNGFLKLVVCAYRPWIRDARIEPYGDSKVAATGYSFPSGHSTWATSCWGSIGFWFRKRVKAIMYVLFALILLTLFSRNYLGVHTPQDVVVGLVASTIMVIAANYIEAWSDKEPDKRDIIIIITGLVVCVALTIFYFTKSYPMDYNAEGNLIVDPMRMLPDSFEGIGLISAFVVCRYFERRSFDFEKELKWKDRFVIGTIALIPLMWWFNHIGEIITALGSKILGKYIWGVGIVVYSMILVPWVMKKLQKYIQNK